MIYRFMRTLILENSSEVTYHVPFSRSFSVVVDGFTHEEIDGIKRSLSGDSQNGADLYSTEIIFDRDKLVNLLSSGTVDLGPAVDSIEIRTNIDSDPVTDDVAEMVSARINTQISLRKKEPTQGDKREKADTSGLVDVSGLSVSNRLIDMLKGFEGFRAYPYTCPGGSLTIGYGTTMKPGQYTSITKEQAEALLRKTVSAFERSVRSLVKVPLNQNQFDAIVSFSYNVGIGALKRSTLLKKLNSGDYNEAANELLKFTKANGKILDGLVKRRERERRLFLT